MQIPSCHSNMHHSLKTAKYAPVYANNEETQPTFITFFKLKYTKHPPLELLLLFVNSIKLPVSMLYSMFSTPDSKPIYGNFEYTLLTIWKYTCIFAPNTMHRWTARYTIVFIFFQKLFCQFGFLLLSCRSLSNASAAQ